MKNNWLVIRSKTFPVSLSINKRVPMMLLWLGLVTFAAVVMNVVLGEYPLTPLDAYKTILGLDTGNPDHALIVNTLRLPRTLVALMVGVGLGISGTILQGLTRNPLADPAIIGINAGASLVAVTIIVLAPSVPSLFLPFCAFAGALTVAILIYFLSWNQGSSPIRLILVGVGIAAIASALTSLIVTFGEIYSASEALVWLVGSVYGRSWEQVISLLPWIVIFVPLALVLARHLNVLNLGDDIARSLGSSVEWQRGLLLFISVALAAASVAAAGTIGFVGLIASHLGRKLVGTTHQSLIPVAGIMGGTIVVLADLLGRMLFAPIEIPCGVVTAAVGAPYFLYLLIRDRD
jgi:iron complex transport system permease protein